MYKIWLVNFDYYLQDCFITWQEAVAKARSVGFMVRIDCGNVMVGSVCPINGTTVYCRELAA